MHGEGLSFFASRAQTLGLATAIRGACHLRNRYTLEEFSLPEDVTKILTGRPIPQDPTTYEGKEGSNPFLTIR